MGAADSKLTFRKGVFRLFESRNIPANDEYWSQYWLLPESADDVFSLIGASDIRRVRDNARENLETLIFKLLERIQQIMQASDFPSPQNSTLHLLNCIRILTRIMPFVFETEELADWEKRIFWTPISTRRKSKKTSVTETKKETVASAGDDRPTAAESTQDGTDGTPADSANKSESQVSENNDQEKESITYQGERLLAAVIDLLFMSGFTIPTNIGSGLRFNYVIWEPGVGSNSPIGTTKEFDSNKAETLRLLLVLLSKSMYMTGGTLIAKENPYIKYVVLKMERKPVLALLCSLLNTTMKYNPAGWGVPYNHVVFADSRERLVTLCLQVLLVLLDYRTPGRPLNIYGESDGLYERRRTGSIDTVASETDTVSSIASLEPPARRPSKAATPPPPDGRSEVTETRDSTSTDAQASGASSTLNGQRGRYLPSGVDNAFRYYVSKLHRTQDFQFLMDGIYRILSNPMQANNTYLPGSTKQIRCHPEMLMLCWKLFEANYRFRAYLHETDRILDVLIVLLYYALENKSDPAQIGLVRTCAFMLQTISADRDFGVKINKVFEGHGSLPGIVRIPAFHGTYADFMIISIYALIATSHGLLHSLYSALILTIANVSPYLKNLSVASTAKLVHLFSSFASPGFLLAEEGNHLLVQYMLEAFNNIVQYQYTDNPNIIYGVVRSHKKFEELSEFTLAKGLTEIKKIQERKKASRSSPTTRQVDAQTRSHQEESHRPDALDNDSGSHTRDENQDEFNEKEDALHSGSSHKNHVEHSDKEDGQGTLSEKARGKLPEGVDPPTRHQSEEPQRNSSVIVTPFAVGKSGFVPTEDWVSTWHVGLPIKTMLILLSELVPKVQSLCTPQSLASDSDVMALLQSVTLVGILPPPQPIVIHNFQWSEASVVWFSSLLWGQVYMAAMSYLGVYNGTNVRLFLVKTSAKDDRIKNVIGGTVSGMFDRLSSNVSGVASGGASEAVSDQTIAAVNSATAETTSAVAATGITVGKTSDTTTNAGSNTTAETPGTVPSTIGGTRPSTAAEALSDTIITVMVPGSTADIEPSETTDTGFDTTAEPSAAVDTELHTAAGTVPSAAVDTGPNTAAGTEPGTTTGTGPSAATASPTAETTTMDRDT